MTIGQLTTEAAEDALDVALDLPGKVHCVRFTWSDPEIALSSLVPAARRLCDEVVHRTVAKAQLDGAKIPCRKSCSACCRYLVPLSAPEAMLLSSEFATLPPPASRRLQRNFEQSLKRLTAAPPPQDALELNHPRELSRWYKSLGLACPLLRKETCSAYSRRPLACREHTAVNNGRSGTLAGCPGLARLAMPISVLEALAELTSSISRRPLESIMLPMMGQWIADNADFAAQTFSTRELLQSLGTILQRQAALRSQSVA